MQVLLFSSMTALVSYSYGWKENTYRFLVVLVYGPLVALPVSPQAPQVSPQKVPPQKVPPQAFLAHPQPPEEGEEW